MSLKTQLRLLLFTFVFMALAGCATRADPEPYLAYDCEQLKLMADTQTQINPFEAYRVGPDPQSGLTGDRAGLRQENANAAQKRDDEQRAIRAAYKEKSCKA